MDEHGRIKTQFDDLLDSIKNGGGKPISVHALAAASGMTVRDVLKWAEILEKDGKVRMHNSIDSTYVSWLSGTDPGAEAPGPAQPKIKLDIVKSINVGDVVVTQGRNSASDHDILIAQHHEDRAKATKDMPVSPINLDIAAYHRSASRHPREQKGAQKPPKEAKHVDSKADIVGQNGHLQKIGDMLSSFHGKKKSEAKNIPLSSVLQEVSPPPQEPEKSQADENQAAELLARLEAGFAHQEDESYSSELDSETERETAPEPEISVPKNAYETEEPEFVVDNAGANAKRPAKFAPALPAMEKIEAVQPLKMAGVPVRLSEKLSKHLQKIEAQAGRIKSLRAEKEKLLNEHYIPIQRKLESELETVSDRILSMEKNIMEMQKRAISMPEKIGEIDQVQLSTLKAHDEIRRAYDEASALIEESNHTLSEERDKIESMLEKGRQEIAQHRAKTGELLNTLERITQMEAESAQKVDVAREVLHEALDNGSSGHYQSFSALVDDQVAGWICYGPAPCTVGTYDIYWIVVDARQQRRGIGVALMREAETRIRAREGRVLIIETAGQSLYGSTRRFYQRLGYVEEARLRDFYMPGDDKIVYIKRL